MQCGVRAWSGEGGSWVRVKGSHELGQCGGKARVQTVVVEPGWIRSQLFVSLKHLKHIHYGSCVY
jgi:hypothetical protein